MKTSYSEVGNYATRSKVAKKVGKKSVIEQIYNGKEGLQGGKISNDVGTNDNDPSLITRGKKLLMTDGNLPIGGGKVDTNLVSKVNNQIHGKVGKDDVKEQNAGAVLTLSDVVEHINNPGKATVCLLVGNDVSDKKSVNGPKEILMLEKSEKTKPKKK